MKSFDLSRRVAIALCQPSVCNEVVAGSEGAARKRKMIPCWRRLPLVDFDGDHAGAHHPERACGTHGDVDDAAAHERPAIIDDALDRTSCVRSHRDNASIGFVRWAQVMPWPGGGGGHGRHSRRRDRTGRVRRRGRGGKRRGPSGRLASFIIPGCSPARTRVAHSGSEMTRMRRFVGMGTARLRSITQAGWRHSFLNARNPAPKTRRKCRCASGIPRYDCVTRSAGIVKLEA